MSDPTSAYASNYTNTIYPAGIGSLYGMSSQVRPIAGCIKLEFYGGGANGTALNNIGGMIAYEGIAGDVAVYKNSPTTGKAFFPTVSNTTFALLGMATTATTQGVEAIVNIPASNEVWQTFKDLTPNTADTASDFLTQSASEVPVAMVGGSGFVPGAQYLISGAIVYEWIPNIGILSGASSAEASLNRNQNLLDKVVKQLRQYGPMLVGQAVKYMTGMDVGIIDSAVRMAISGFIPQVTQPARPALQWR
jgi:hypothetical protein